MIINCNFEKPIFVALSVFYFYFERPNLFSIEISEIMFCVDPGFNVIRVEDFKPRKEVLKLQWPRLIYSATTQIYILVPGLAQSNIWPIYDITGVGKGIVPME